MKLSSARLTVFAAGLGMFMSISPAFAQDAAVTTAPAVGKSEARPVGPRPIHPMLIHQALRQIDLSEEQKTKIKEIQDKSQKEMMTLRQEMMPTTAAMAKMSPAERQEAYMKVLPKVEQLTKDAKDEIEKVLTPEQKKQFEENVQQIQERYSGQGFRRSPGATTAPAEAMR